MAIQLRRGDYEDFDKTKMQEGEVAVVTGNDPNTESGCATYVSYASGDEDKVKRLVHEEDYNKDFDNFSAEIEQEVNNLFTGLELDEAIVRKAFDDLNINGENLYDEIQELKPTVIGDGIEGEWKRATIVIPELTFTHYEGSQYSPTYTGTAVTLDDFVPEDIQDAIVVNVLAYRRSYAGTRLYDIGCGYCSKVPTGKWAVTLYDKDISESEFTVFTVLDILYK